MQVEKSGQGKVDLSDVIEGQLDIDAPQPLEISLGEA